MWLPLVPPRGVIRPPLPPYRLGSSSPERSVPLLPFTTCQSKETGLWKAEFFQRGEAPSPPLGDSSHKASGWAQMRPVFSKWGVSRPMHHMLQPRLPGNKLTQDNADSGVYFITLAGPRQSLLLARDPGQHLWESFIPRVQVSKPIQTHHPKFLETYIN